MNDQQVQAWLENFYACEREAANLLACSMWAVAGLAQLRKQIESNAGSNVYDFASGKKVHQSVEPFPDQSMRNFQEIGKSLDKLFSGLSKL